MIKIEEEIRIEATAERIYDALSLPDQRVKWWGRAGAFQAQQMESDLRPEGEWWMSGMVGERPFKVTGRYLEVDPPKTLAFTWIADWGDLPPTVIRFELEEDQNGTTVRLTQTGFTEESQKKNFRGWPGLLDMLRNYVMS